MKKVYVTRRIPEVGLEMLRGKGYEVDVYQGEGVPSQEEIIEALKKKEYDAVLTLLTDSIDARVFDAAPSVKLYANYAIGFDNIDIMEAQKRGIVVTNTPGDYAYTVAEHAMALILGLATRLAEADQFVRDGKYAGWDPMIFIGTELKGKTLGLVGAGRIGSHLARMAHNGFDIHVLYYDVARNESLEKEYAARYVELDELLKQADVVSLHVPLLDSTRHLIDRKKLALMKPTAFLINTARGAVVDEMALVEVLKQKNIAGAGLDVFEHEPVLTPGLAELSNIILTPHIASACESARNEMARIAAENIIDLFEGRIPRNKVNV